MECRYLSAKGGDGCGLARFLVALGGGGFAAAKMSADDRGSMGMVVSRRSTVEKV